MNPTLQRAVQKKISVLMLYCWGKSHWRLTNVQRKHEKINLAENVLSEGPRRSSAAGWCRRGNHRGNPWKRWLKAPLSIPSVIFSLLLTCEELGPLPSPRASNARQHYSWCTPTTLSHLSRSWVVRK